jgi:hypothetical protein
LTGTIENEIVIEEMKKIILIAALFALIIVFFYAPFIVLNPPILPGGGEPCSKVPQGFLCNLNPTVSIFGYLYDREPILSISWEVLIVAFIVAFAIFCGELTVLAYVIKFQVKKHKPTVILLKVLTILALVAIPLYILSLVLSFFGLSFTL